jgi:AMP nucleosidase
LAYYTGTSPEDFQQYIIVTNYPMYPELFKEISRQLMSADPEYYDFVVPAAMRNDGGEQNSRKLPQMPAFHLKRRDKSGVTLVNFGVGPSNASTFIENVAPLRPSLVLMVGHCGGLRGEIQTIGTYVLPEGYFRRDRLYDDILPLDQQILPMAEVNIALKNAISGVFNVTGERLREILQTGTVASTNFRMWEVDPASAVCQEIRESRSLAVDMESAVVAAACTRWAIPFGGLLVISDLPFHGEVKSEGRAHEFYQGAIDNHLKVALEAIDRIRKEAPYVLFSRKLRNLDAPAFR